ncbi:hypothetical protein T492DRAFT_631898, partial [Pavlovales sp. CCMP2436]
MSWAVSPQEAAQYEGYFTQLDTARSGLISGAQASSFLAMSGLSKEALEKIWGMSDVDRDGHLTRAEFRIAMHLAMRVARGSQLPATLPPVLARGARSSAAESVGLVAAGGVGGGGGFGGMGNSTGGGGAGFGGISSSAPLVRSGGPSGALDADMFGAGGGGDLMGGGSGFGGGGGASFGSSAFGGDAGFGSDAGFGGVGGLSQPVAPSSSVGDGGFGGMAPPVANVSSAGSGGSGGFGDARFGGGASDAGFGGPGGFGGMGPPAPPVAPVSSGGALDLDMFG